MSQTVQPAAGCSPFRIGVTDTPAKMGGALQGYVSVGAQNIGSNTVYVLPVSDGDTPTASAVKDGEQLEVGGTFSSLGTVLSLGGSSVAPQFWVCCDSGLTSILTGFERT